MALQLKQQGSVPAISYSGRFSERAHINVNLGSVWNLLAASAFYIVDVMRDMPMTYDAQFGELPHSLVQSEDNLALSQENKDNNVPARVINHVQKTATYEMLIGPWYLDEFGNPTREIKARD